MLATVLLARAEEALPPLIDVDGTLLVQFGLFLLMFIVLRFALFGPYLKMREQRRKGIEGAREEAHGMDAKARAIVADYDVKIGRAKQRGAEERMRVRSEAAVREREILGKARDESNRGLDDARKGIAKDADAARATLAAESAALAKQMVKRILGREVA